MRLRARITSTILLVLLTIPPLAASLDRSRCLAYISSQLANGTLSPDDEVFKRDENGTPQSSPENPVLTLDGCYKLCGEGWTFYPDRGPRINTWIFPVLILISNIEVSPLDKRRYFM